MLPIRTTIKITTTHLAKSLSLRPKTLTTAPQPTHFADSLSVHSFCSESLKISAKRGLLFQGKQVHAHIVTLGFYNFLSLQNQVLNFYVKCNEFDHANKLFDEMRVRNVVTWNTVIHGLVRWGNIYMGFSYFRRMLVDEVVLDAITLNSMLHACLELNDVEVIGKQVHCFVVKLGFELDCFVGCALVELYGKCGFLKEARHVFDGVVSRDVVLWNVMLCCYALNGLGEEALGVFNLMRVENLVSDVFTFSSLLNSCGTLVSHELGIQIHSLIVKLSFDSDVFVASGLVDMYAKCENIGDACKVFNGMAARNSVSWNTIIVAYGMNGDGKAAMSLLRLMLQEEFVPDELTLSSILSSSGRVAASCEISQVHAYLIRHGFKAFLSIANALINAYSKCGSIASALQCFKTVSKPDLVTWASIIGAYAFHGLPKQSIEIFEKMLSNGVTPDRVAFLGVLSACSHAGLITEGLHYFGLMTKDYQIMPDIEHYTCLVHLLGLAGLLDDASNILTSMRVKPGSDTWGAFIGACKIHGDIELAKWAAEKLFKMEPKRPVNYTLISNMYASEGHWCDVARVRKLMRDKCDQRIPGYSWMELSGKVHSFFSGDKTHLQALDVHGILEALVGLLKVEYPYSRNDIALNE